MAASISSGPGSTAVKVLTRTEDGGAGGFTVGGVQPPSPARSISVRLRTVAEDVILDWHSPAGQRMSNDSWSFRCERVIPVGGMYKWDIRFERGSDSVTESLALGESFGVGLVFLAAGQSNMYEWWGTSDDGEDACDALSYFYGSGSWTDLSGVNYGNGLHRFVKTVRDGLSGTDLEDAVVAVLGVAKTGSALIRSADAIGTGSWDGSIYDGGAYLSVNDYIQGVVDASGCRGFDAVLWHQGEAETLSRMTSTGYTVGKTEYADALRALRTKISDQWYNGLYGSDVPMVIGTVGSLESYVEAAATPACISGMAAQVVEQAQAVAQDTKCAWVTVNDQAPLTSGSYVGAHYSATGYENMAGRYANASLNLLGADTSVSSKGPRIIRAAIGTGSSPYDRTKVTLFVEHDKGSSLSLGTNGSNSCFQVADAHGLLAVTGVATGTEGGYDTLVLTVERDMTQTDSTGDDYEVGYPGRIIGNYILVRYLGYTAIEGSECIVDDLGVPLRPSFGMNVASGEHPIAHSAVWSYPWFDYGVIVGAISSVDWGNTQITVTSPDSWLRSGVGQYRIPQPGDFIAFNAVADGAFHGTSIVRKVVTYTDAGTDLVIELVDDMDGYQPSATDQVSIHCCAMKAGGILGRARTQDYFGEVY